MGNQTLTEYMTENDWDEKDAESKINVLATFIIDLENEVYE